MQVSRTARIHQSLPPGSIRQIWLVAHGFGQLSTYFIRNFSALSQQGIAVIVPEALSRFYLQGNAGRVGASWMTKEDRETEIADYVAYLDRVYTELILPKGDIPVVAFGFSQGAATISRWVADTQFPLQHLVLWGGFFPPDLNWTGFYRNDRKFTTWLVNGKTDTLISAQQRQQMDAFIDLLPEAPQIMEFDGGHEIPEKVLLQLVRAMGNLE